MQPNAPVAVIGSGTMGAGIAQVAAVAGHPVKLYDVNAAAVQSAISGVRDNLQKLASKGRLSAEAAQAAGARLKPAQALQDLADSHLVIEAVIEDLATKQRVFTELEAIVPGHCILASNTSSLSITAIGAALRNSGRLAGMHFFNPAPVMELVEVVSGLATTKVCSDAVAAIASAWGKTPVQVKSTPGFIVNRVARPFYGEALRLLAESAAAPASIDAVMRESGAFRMGPFELMDLIGHDVNFAVTRSVFDAYFGDPRFTPSLIQQELVHAGFLGRKSGRGFYHYRAPAITPQPDTERTLPAKRGAPLIREQFRADLFSKQEIRIRDAAVALTDGRTATQRSREAAIRDLVLVDLAFDFVNASRIAVAKSAQCSEAAYRSAVAAFQSAGYAVTRLPDLPGLAVMRTVAMLINEAADAVNQRVCTVDAVNVAMRKGANYPAGPLEWADRIGISAVHTVLTNLGAYYGEDRYRISPLLTQLLWSGGRFHGYENV